MGLDSETVVVFFGALFTGAFAVVVYDALLAIILWVYFFLKLRALNG